MENKVKWPALDGFRLYVQDVPLAQIAERMTVSIGVVQGWHKRHKWKARRDTMRQRIWEAEVLAVERVISEAKPRFLRNTVQIIDQMQAASLESLRSGDGTGAARLASAAHAIAKDVYRSPSAQPAEVVDVTTLRSLGG